MEILRFPLVRFCGLFVPGIVCSYYMKPDLVLVLTVFSVCFVALCAGYLLTRNHVNPVLFGLLLGIVAVGSGAVTQSVHAYYNQRSNYINHITNCQANATFCLSERLKNGAHSVRYVADVIQIGPQPASGKILLHFKNSERFSIATTLIAHAVILKNTKPLNPAQFDYGKYLDDKSIPAQCYLDKSQYTVIGTARNLSYYADRMRNKMIASLRQHDFGETELQVLHALILGQQQEISREVIKDYQFAGAVHVLSVSGLHVGFVMLFVNFVLRRLPKTRRWQSVRIALILLSLWGFAFVAGLAASVVRSATMFSFVAIGKNLSRSTNTFHTLVVSALLILLFEPAFILDVGFQLSYAALVFILWLQPLFAGIWKPRNKVVHYFWEIITVSFARS